MNFFVTLQRPRQQIILTMRRYLRSARGSYLLNIDMKIRTFYTVVSLSKIAQFDWLPKAW